MYGVEVEIQALLNEREQLVDKAKALDKAAVNGKRHFTAAEDWEWEKVTRRTGEIEREIDAKRHEAWGGTPQSVALDVGGSPSRAVSKLRPGEVRTLAKNERFADVVDHNLPDGIQPHELNIGRFVSGLVTGNWRGREAEQRALSVGSDTAGGTLVPSFLSAEVIDLARNKARVFQAGAQTIPMESSELVLAKVTSDGSTAWKAESVEATASDMVFGKVTLRAKSLVGFLKASVELFEDAPNVDALVNDSLSATLALELDRVALFGTGASAEPGPGLRDHSDVNEISMGANGLALPDYNTLIQGIEDVLDANGPSEGLAAIYAPRTWSAYAQLKDGNSNYLALPTAVESLQRLVTNQVGVAETQGSATDASSIFVGNFAELLVGVRTNLTIEVTRVGGASDSGAFSSMQVWVRAYLRADIAFGHADQFCRIIGIIP